VTIQELANASAAERAAYFTVAGQYLKLSPVIVEKDFWVCWMLKLIFELPNAVNDLTFKGGTSLSKVFKAISRFSEWARPRYAASDSCGGGVIS